VPLAQNFTAAGGSLGIFRVGGLFSQTVAGFANGLPNFGWADHSRDVAHRYFFGRWICLTEQYAFKRVEQFFEGLCVSRIGHVFNYKAEVANSHIVANRTNSFHQVGKLHHLWVKTHCGPLGREVDQRFLYAFGFIQAFFNRRHTVGAGHAKYRQVYLPDFCHKIYSAG
jgi:hypothetical protein